MDTALNSSKNLQSPPFSGVVHVGRPNVLDKAAFMRRVEQLLDNRVFSNNGPFVDELEQIISTRLSVPHSIAVANATLGLELVLEALELKGEIILPSFTFVATAHAAMRQGLQPVFCDIDPTSGLIDPSAVEKLITDKTTAIMAVNVYGNVCDVEGLSSIAKRHGLRLIFDSAHALGVSLKGTPVGGFGDVEVFSLHATKFINGFEGGIITTKNPELAQKIRSLRNFGFVTYDEVECIGTNAKLSEIHAAMAVTNLEYIDDIISLNRSNYECYQKLLPPWIRLVAFPDDVESNYQYVVAVCPEGTRNELVDFLHANNVLARKYFYPGLHRMKPYKTLNCSLPYTELLAETVMCLPTGQSVNEEIIAFICALVDQFKRGY